MKRIDIVDIIILVTLFATMLFLNDMRNQRDEDMERIERRFDILEERIRHRTELDSLYWNHIEVCVFELREDVQYTYHN